MTKPFTIATSLTTSTATAFITAGENPIIVKNLYVHNTGAGNATCHLTYIKRDSYNGITTSYDMWTESINAGNYTIINDIICINPFDSLAWRDNSNTINLIAHCVGIT